MKKFSQWLTEELINRNMKPADLVRLSGLDSAVISNLINGKRNAGTDTATAIASALKLPPAEVFRAAGLLPPEPNKDEILYRIEHLYHTLKEPGNKYRALEYMEYLIQSEEKNDRQGKKLK